MSAGNGSRWVRAVIQIDSSIHLVKEALPRYESVIYNWLPECVRTCRCLLQHHRYPLLSLFFRPRGHTDLHEVRIKRRTPYPPSPMPSRLSRGLPGMLWCSPPLRQPRPPLVRSRGDTTGMDLVSAPSLARVVRRIYGLRRDTVRRRVQREWRVKFLDCRSVESLLIPSAFGLRRFCEAFFRVHATLYHPSTIRIVIEFCHQVIEILPEVLQKIILSNGTYLN